VFTQGRLWAVLTILAVAGLVTSAYLTYSHYADDPTVCAGIGSCEFVQTSKYSEIAGVPVALMGLAYFIAMICLCGVRLLRGEAVDSWVRPVVFTLTLGSSFFVAYLTYVELFVIDAICVWCVATASITITCMAVVVWIIASAAREEAWE
jgi:uncharacterized membrane protein